MSETTRNVLAENCDIISKAYGEQGTNFMTPRVTCTDYFPCAEDGPIAGYVTEKSKGRGFRGNPLYGVSLFIFSKEGKRLFPQDDVSDCYHDSTSARNAYRRLVARLSRKDYPAAKE